MDFGRRLCVFAFLALQFLVDGLQKPGMTRGGDQTAFAHGINVGD
jgi:hypothetical protein